MKSAAAKKKSSSTNRTKATKASDKKKQNQTKKRPSRKASTATKHKKSSKKKIPTTPASNPITNYVLCENEVTPSVTSIPFATPSPLIRGFKCKGCRGTASTCKEIRWKWICLHQVIDYFENVGCENVEVEAAKEAYVNAYHVLGKLELLNKHSLYSTNSHFSIPQCMVHGSYQMAIDMTKSQKLYSVLMQIRVYDVDDHLGYKLSVECFVRDHPDGE